MKRRACGAPPPRPIVVLAALLFGACHAALDDRAPPDLAPPPLFIDLVGTWTFSADAQPSSDPTAAIDNNGSGSVTVAFHGSGGCGCSARHLLVDLPRTLYCAGTTLSFDWTSTGAFDSTDSTALRIDFFSHGQWNKGQRFVASTWAGPSNCAFLTGNQFPSPPVLASGHNEIALGGLMQGVSGLCSSPFDGLDIHVEGYTCNGSLSATLSNFVLR